MQKKVYFKMKKLKKKKNYRVFITDYIKKPSIEKKILKKNLINISKKKMQKFYWFGIMNVMNNIYLILKI